MHSCFRFSSNAARMAVNPGLCSLTIQQFRPSAAARFTIGSWVRTSQLSTQEASRKLAGEEKGAVERSNEADGLEAVPLRRKEDISLFAGFSGLTSITEISLFDATLKQIGELAVFLIAGVAYFKWHKCKILRGVGKAFDARYDSALELAPRSLVGCSTEGVDDDVEHLRQQEQHLVDRIISGQEKGHYYMLLGSKGSGKAAMILNAMKKINANGVAFCHAHPDLEIFRQRLGKALNYKFSEDALTTLFKRRDPHKGGPASDIERVMLRGNMH